MLKELVVDLEKNELEYVDVTGLDLYGKALAVRRIIDSPDPVRTVYLTGYTPLSVSGLGFAGKLGVYGVSLLGGNLQGARGGGLVARYLARHGIVGLRLVGDSADQKILTIDREGRPELVPLGRYGTVSPGTAGLAACLYRQHGQGLGLALTDPATTGFLYNAVVTNTRPGGRPDRAAARATSRFGANGLVGVAVARADQPAVPTRFEPGKITGLLKSIHQSRWNPGLTGSDDPELPGLGGTYGAAAKARFDKGLALTDLFRGARVPEEHYQRLLPETIAREQMERSIRLGGGLQRRSCLPGCPNKCLQAYYPDQAEGNARSVKAGEWETYQGLINLGLFDRLGDLGAEILAHSNNHAYDHIEALTALAAMALTGETRADTGVRYGDESSVLAALNQAVEGRTEVGRLIRRGAAAVEAWYGLEPTFTVGGHGLPYHNPRAVIQTGVGLSWTYGRHGEVCAGPGRHNFLGAPYSGEDHGLPPETHVLNTIHAMILFNTLDELGLCFFMGPTVDTLVDSARIMEAMGTPADPRDMVRRSARTLLAVHDFNAGQGVTIQPLPRIFYETATYGNKQTPDQAVVFDVPFETIRDYGLEALKAAADGGVTIPDAVLAASERGR